jgi:hypothetical protein
LLTADHSNAPAAIEMAVLNTGFIRDARVREGDESARTRCPRLTQAKVIGGCFHLPARAAAFGQ